MLKPCYTSASCSGTESAQQQQIDAFICACWDKLDKEMPDGAEVCSGE